MFKNVKDGLNLYKKELGEYIKRVEELKKQYGDLQVMGWDEQDYQYVMGHSQQLRAMERVLGLSEEEIKQIEKEVESSIK